MPPENSTGYVKNIDTNKVLGVETDYLTVLEEKLSTTNNTEQKWKREMADKRGYFYLTNSAIEKVLTAKSKDKLTIEGMSLLIFFLLCVF